MEHSEGKEVGRSVGEFDDKELKRRRPEPSEQTDPHTASPPSPLKSPGDPLHPPIHAPFIIPVTRTPLFSHFLPGTHADSEFPTKIHRDVPSRI